jgi:PleD family two-component response regulator
MKARILVIDDSTANNILCRSMFEEEGHYVVTMESGKQALREVTRIKPDIVLLDVMMEGIDGFDVLREFQSNESTRSIPVIMISASDDRRMMEKAINMGAIDFVSKPIGTNRLYDKVLQILKAS